MPLPCPANAPTSSRAALLVLVLGAGIGLGGLSGCAVPPPKPIGLMDVAERPAEKALLAGIRAYDDAQYPLAEQSLTEALKTGLASPRDRAVAHKLLAFVFCTSDRLDACEAEFRAARVADPAFVLGKAEVGHPQWGPVYQKLPPR